MSRYRRSAPSTRASRLSAGALILSAALVATTCMRPVSRLPAAAGAEPEIRIGVAIDARSVSISSSSGFDAGSGGNWLFSVPGSRELVAAARAGRIVTRGAVRDSGYQTLTLAPASGGTMSIDGISYKGSVVLQASDHGVTAINTVALETYLAGVVGVEMGERPSSDLEAVKAQAIASRTYAVRNMGKFSSSGFDLMGSVADQAYFGVDRENPVARTAVRETRGEIITYRGMPIDVFFHSTCGFATAHPEEVFATVGSTPYLLSVSDRNGDGYFCDISPHFRWRVEWERAELEAILRRTLPAVLGIDPAEVQGFRSLSVYRTGISGRVTELRIAVAGGEIPVSGPSLRSVLRQPDGRALGSTALQVVDDGDPERIIAVGGGWGHGVGMCQWGAIGRARAGQSHSRIITTYFPGTRIERYY